MSEYITDIYVIRDDQLEEQIQLRVDLIKTLVGNLYPNILYEEITHLRKRKNALAAAARGEPQPPVIDLSGKDAFSYNPGSADYTPPKVTWRDGWDNK